MGYSGVPSPAPEQFAQPPVTLVHPYYHRGCPAMPRECRACSQSVSHPHSGISCSVRLLALLLSVLLLPAPSFADDVWDKPPAKWSLKDAYRILEDSPWSPAKSKLEVGFSNSRPIDPLTTAPATPSETAAQRGGQMSVDLSRGTPQSPVTILWWSSRTVRIAQQRLRQLLDKSALQTPPQADALPDIIIHVEGGEAFRILRDAGDDLRESSYLDIGDGSELDPASIEFHEKDSSGDAYVAFHFPRELSRNPTVTPDMDTVIFRCKATAKKPAPNRPNQLSIRAVFEPVKMRVVDHPDF
jgi:hypothetical protein